MSCPLFLKQGTAWVWIRLSLYWSAWVWFKNCPGGCPICRDLCSICRDLRPICRSVVKTGHLIQRSSGSFLWFWSLCLLTVCVLFVFFVTKMMRQSVMTTLVWLLIIGLKLGLEPITSLWRSRKELGRLFVPLSGQLFMLTGHWRELWSWLSHDLSGRTKIAPWPTAVHYSNGKTWSRSQAPES